MGFIRSYLLSLLLYVSIINEIRQPAVTCLDEEGSQQCIPKRIFIALMRSPEFNSGMAAYMRTTRIAQRSKEDSDIDQLMFQFSLAESDDSAEVCIPLNLYLELLRYPALQGYLMARTHKLEFPGSLLNSSDEGTDSRELIREAEKRNLATLAKNGDLPILPIATQDRNDDNEKRSDSSDNVDDFMRDLLDERAGRMAEMYDYLLPELESEVMSGYAPDKRNVGSLARDFALPPSRRHIASVIREFGLPNGKRNIGALAKQSMLPLGGKRNVASLARHYTLPQPGKRNVAALARDAALPYGKRYLGSLVRSGGYPTRDYDQGKRSVASLARNGDWPAKRGSTAAVGRMIARVLNRHGRSLNDDRDVPNEPLDLQQLIRQTNGDRLKEDVPTSVSVESLLDDSKTKNRSNRKTDAASQQTRHKRQLDFSDEYPLPVMQNTNMLEYEDMVETLADHYPEKRFMGSAPEAPTDSTGYPEVLQASKRHIGALARLGWLPSFRAPRFSRSPRYLVERENPADGSSSNYTPDASTRSLRPMFALKHACSPCTEIDHHGFKRFLLLPDADNFLRTSNSRLVPRSM